MIGFEIPQPLPNALISVQMLLLCVLCWNLNSVIFNDDVIAKIVRVSFSQAGKGFIIILAIFGLCLQHQFYQMVVQKEVYLFHVF